MNTIIGLIAIYFAENAARKGKDLQLQIDMMREEILREKDENSLIKAKLDEYVARLKKLEENPNGNLS